MKIIRFTPLALLTDFKFQKEKKMDTKMTLASKEINYYMKKYLSAVRPSCFQASTHFHVASEILIVTTHYSIGRQKLQQLIYY